MRALLVFWLLCLACLEAMPLQPEHVVVVYNAQSEHSMSCALDYARLRQIPSRNLVPLNCSPTLHDISRAQYNELVKEPLLKAGRSQGLHYPAARSGGGEPVYAMVLMPDLPVRITEPRKLYGEAWKKTSAASVDSELALLGADYALDKMINNPVFGKKTDLVMERHYMMPVTRIDSPSRKVSERLITSPIEVERAGGLRGWVLIDRSGPHVDGDKILKDVKKLALGARQAVQLDALPGTFPAHFPLPQPAAAYFGWYSEHADGPFSYARTGHEIPSPQVFNFTPGAVAVHIHSYSATQIRSAEKGWVGALLMRGADVTAGNVWEPYLGGSLHLALFYARLMEGHCVAEAAAMATPLLSWQGIVFGDPLYRPWPKGALPVNHTPGMVACRAMCEGKWGEAEAGFKKIIELSQDSDVLMRSELALFQIFWLQNKKQEAKKYLEGILERHAYNPYIGAAQALMARLFPAPSAKPSHTKK